LTGGSSPLCLRPSDEADEFLTVDVKAETEAIPAEKSAEVSLPLFACPFATFVEVNQILKHSFVLSKVRSAGRSIREVQLGFIRDKADEVKTIQEYFRIL